MPRKLRGNYEIFLFLVIEMYIILHNDLGAKFSLLHGRRLNVYSLLCYTI